MRHMERTLLFVSGCELNIASPVRDLGSCLSPCNQTCLSVPRGLSSNWRARAPSLSSPEPASRAVRSCCFWAPAAEPCWPPGPGAAVGAVPRHTSPPPAADITAGRSSPVPGARSYTLHRMKRSVPRVCCEFQRGFPGSGFMHVKWIERVVFSWTVKNGGTLQG